MENNYAVVEFLPISVKIQVAGYLLDKLMALTLGSLQLAATRAFWFMSMLLKFRHN